MFLSSPRDTCQWVLSGAETYRLSSRSLFRNKSIGFKGWGGNLQNKSDDIRRLYKADSGKLLVQVDQAGAEALIVAYLARHGKFRDLFLNGIKSHTFVALHLFQSYWSINAIPEIAEIKDLPIVTLGNYPRMKEISNIIRNDPNPFYFIGKKACHAANYMMRGNTFATDVLKESGGKVRLSIREADRFLNMYHSLFPEIHLWQLETEQMLSRGRILRNLQGFPREFTGAWSDSLIREGVAFVPQSTVGTIINMAIVEMQEYIEMKNLDWDILENCHDSMLLQCNIEDVSNCVKKAKEFIEIDLVSPRGEKFKMKSEVSVGSNWGKWHETKNPLGMKEIKI